MASNEDKKGGHFMQASDPDLLKQIQLFCAIKILLHVGMNVPLQLQLDVIRVTTDQRWHAVTYLCHAEAVYLFLPSFPEPFNVVF